MRKYLKIKSTAEPIAECQLKWFGHLSTMPNERPAKMIWEAKLNQTDQEDRKKRSK